jgi:hypothetical protein
MSTKVDKSEMFSGKSDGITFEKLDEKVLSWGRKKFGDKYATLLWKDELTDLTKLDLKDELEAFEYNMHCTMVYDVLGYDSAKYADGLFETTRFWSLEYQLQTRQRFREKMFCYLETIVKGEAARQIKKQGVRRMAKMRKFLFERFGAGQPEILEERVRKYHLGMPDPKTGEPFPPRCDMEAKLDALEAEREYLVEMCPLELREGYEDGKETTLVRIILRHRPREYDSAVKTVMDLHRFRLYAKEGDLKKITNLEDNSRVVYNTDWLPNYDELRVALIAEYNLQKRRRDEHNQSTKRSPGHPVLPVLQGFNQPGPQEKTCYGCGEKGHFKGDAECSAGPNEVWSGAPEGFKARIKGGGKGKGKGKSVKGRGRGNAGKGNRQRNAKGPSDESQVPCKFWSNGNGYCKWGDNCRHSHSGKKGGKRKGSSTVLLTSKEKKAKKEIVTMVINDLKSAAGKKTKTNPKSEKEDSGDEDLYNLVRGKKSTMMVQKLDRESDDYVPSRRVIMMISSDESEGEEYSPVRPETAELPVIDSEMEPEVKQKDESEGLSSDDDTSESSAGKFQSSSAVPARNRRASASPRAILKSPQKMSRPSPPEAFNLIYKRAQERNDDLSKALEEKIEQQSKYLESLNKYLADAHQRDESDRKTMQKEFLGQINTILVNSQARSDLQEARRVESDMKWREALQKSNERQQNLEKKNEDNRLVQAFKAQQRNAKADREGSISSLKREINYLERKQRRRWKELVHENTWSTYEKDQEATDIDTRLQATRDKIESIIKEEESEENHSYTTFLDPEFDEILIRVKRGENRAYVRHLPGGPEGVFDMSASIHHLIEHKHRLSQIGSSSTEPKYMGFRGGKSAKDSEQTNKKRKVDTREKSKGKEEKAERFDVGDRVYYFNNEPGNEKWHSARVTGYLYPGENGYPDGQSEVVYKIQPDNEGGQRYSATTRIGRNLRAWNWAKPCLVAKEDEGTQPLLPLDRVGIDTCSALSVSSRREDFLWLDESKQAKKSVILRGVGGDTAMIGGRGPMVVKALDQDGNKVVLYDPSGVYLKEAVNQAGFRIFGQQRLKRFGFNLQQNDQQHGGDVLNYHNGLKTIPLETNGGILTLRTVHLDLNAGQVSNLEKEIEGSIKGDVNSSYCIQIDHHTSLLVNEAYLSEEEAARLHHWRVGHRSVGKTSLNEVCPVCVEGKKKVGTFKRNYGFHGHTTGPILPYFRLYCDGYGGQNSMGDVSYQGGIGGYVFACPSGSVKIKLYGSTEQFPSILFQVLQEVESEGFVTREVYVDTHSVNLSRAAEEVAAMFRVRIIPVSAGTPQEMAYAESAVRTIGQMGRTLMCGAPHLPKFCWGLADLYSKEIHDTQVQKKIECSPYQYRTGREPDLDLLFIKVFGAPCQYSPIDGADHKRAPKTEWGWFVGVQNPMCLVLRPEDEKILSVSKKKIIVHEEFYAKFNSANGSNPLAHFLVPVIDIDDVKTQTENLERIKEYKTKFDIPDHVLSIKCLSDYQKHPELNTATPTTHPPERMLQHFTHHTTTHDDKSKIRKRPGEYDKISWPDYTGCCKPGEYDAELDAFVEICSPYQQEDQGGKTAPHVPEHVALEKDLLLDKIKSMREMLNKRFDKNGRVEAIVKALKALREVEEETLNDAPRKGILRKSKPKQREEITKENVLSGKRKRSKETSEPGGVPEEAPESNGRNSSDVDIVKKKKSQIKINDVVKIKTSKFGIGYAKGRPEFTFGKVLKINGKIYDVLWEDDVQMKTHVRHLIYQSNLREKNENDEEPRLFGLVNKETILPILAVGGALSQSQDDSASSWPRDFYEALLRDDWREWVQAVKNENDSWSMFEASSEIPYEQMERGASIIPLGELFSIKRSGKHKFRQYALGNLLKEGKDFGETFSSTVSGDGLRWFCSLACSCRKEIRGWDATTGYLQTQQRVNVYAYLPSHSGYSDLSFEELAPFRIQLKMMEKEGGVKSVKGFARRMKKERRERPKTVLKLNKSVYGIPDAGQSFSMFMQGLHLKHCGMVQSEMDPCVFYKIIEEQGGVVKSYLIVITWVDDCRFFGTEDLVRSYEETITKNCKCTLEGVSREFVSIEINHQVKEGILELTQNEYWVKAIDRFKEFLPATGPKERKVPLSPADEKLLIEPSESEWKEAEHLPFASLLGVCQYPSSFTKLEMRYALSILSRHRTKWGVNHFKALLKALEYGYSTRHLGLRYDGNLTSKELNVIVGFADSSLTVPRSQGCRLVIMNGAAISFSSKKHTTTDDSTTAAELTEMHLCACDVVGFRELLKEIGLEQQEPTVIFQDNQAAIQISMNRGSLSKKTRAMEVRVFSVRNKIEDMKVVPIYLKTGLMLADLGTKALDPALFIFLRDQLCGYAKIMAKM